MIEFIYLSEEKKPIHLPPKPCEVSGRSLLGIYDKILNYALTVLLRKQTMFAYKTLCDLNICHREMDIRKRYEQSSTKIEKGVGMNFVEQTLTLAQLWDLENVTKPRYEVIKTDNRLIKMAELTSKGYETDWTFYPCHKVSNYSKYPRQNLKKSEELWKKQIIIPK